MTRITSHTISQSTATAVQDRHYAEEQLRCFKSVTFLLTFKQAHKQSVFKTDFLGNAVVSQYSTCMQVPASLQAKRYDRGNTRNFRQHHSALLQITGAMWRF